MSIVFPIIGVILTNLLGFNIMISYYQNRTNQIKKYNEYLFYVIFFNCLSWMLYGIVTNDQLIFLCCIISLFFDFWFIQILYKYIDLTKLFWIEILSSSFLIYLITITYLLSFTKINKENVLVPIIGIISTISSISTYISPLIIISEVIKTKSNELIYLPHALIGCINLSCWLIYAIMIKDIYQIITDILGLFMCVIQVCVYIIYSQKTKNTTHIPVEIES
jgi:solute carrier family 50 protein (sugar transporter)